MTIRQALRIPSVGITARELEIFLQHILKLERVELYTHPETTLTAAQSQTLASFLARRQKNEPVAYIIGSREFYGRDFKTDHRALIPRPETEKMIDLGLEKLPDRFSRQLKETNKPCPLRLLELGTGSGNIAITLSLELAAKSIPAEIYATDLSQEALELAKENFAALTLKQAHSPIKFLTGDLFAIPDLTPKAPYDLIIANLPYVPTTWQSDPTAQTEVLFYEPDIALFAGLDGLDLYRRFFSALEPFLMPDGLVMIEFGENQTETLTKLIKKYFPNRKWKIYQDYAGLDRLLLLE